MESVSTSQAVESYLVVEILSWNTTSSAALVEFSGISCVPPKTKYWVITSIVVQKIVPSDVR